MLAPQLTSRQGRLVACQSHGIACAAPRLFAPQKHNARGAVIVYAATVSTNDFKTGLSVEVSQGCSQSACVATWDLNGVNQQVDGQPYRVVEFLHVKPGKGSAFVRSKLKNYLTGGVVEKTFRAGEQLNVADMSKREASFSYVDGDSYVFMDVETYEETRLKKDDWAAFLKEGAVVQLMFYNGKVISVDPPSFVDLQVVETSPNVKGNTASGSGSKPATLETGAVVSVPLFIDVGQTIKIDTRTGQYLSKS